MMNKKNQHKKSTSLLKYKIDNFIARGGGSIFIALLTTFIIAFVVIAAGRGIFFFLSPETSSQYGELDFLGHIYITFLQLTDPGNMAQDILSSPKYKLFAVLAGIAGIVMLSALIAFITTFFDQKISELKRGRSKVIEKGHTLLLGWNEQRVIEIIRELEIANESEDDACIVILANKDKEEMDEVIRLNLGKNKTTRIITRNGKITTMANLDMVSLEMASSLIVMANCTETVGSHEKALSDASVIQTVLAVNKKKEIDDNFIVVAEIFNDAYRKIITNAFSENVIAVNTSDILAKLLVQTSRSVGLSTVYSEILSFNGCEMYFYKNNWQNKFFNELVQYFPDGVPMGVMKADGKILLNPSSAYKMEADDEILIVANDDSTIKLLSSPVATATNYQLADKQLSQIKEKELLLGWNHKSKTIIKEFSDYVIEGSEIDILLSKPSTEIRKEILELDQAIDNININLIEKNSLNQADLISLEPFNYNNIILLANQSDDDINPEEIDAENIVTLLLLRNIFEKKGLANINTKIITEVLDSQNHELVSEAGVKDVIISNRLISMIMSQISENKHIKDVYDDIFEENGSEIYLKPLSLYFNEVPASLSFMDLTAMAQKRNEVCIGIKIKADEQNLSKNQGILLIPEKNKQFALNSDDYLVVLAEDEL